VIIVTTGLLDGIAICEHCSLRGLLFGSSFMLLKCSL
jgi:hypothetical protein